MKAAAYTRTTADEEARGRPGCAAQYAAILDYADREGLEVIDHYSDDSVGPLASAPNLGDFCSRSGLISLLDEAPRKGWLYVISTEATRLQRPDIDFSPAAELGEIGKQVAVVGDVLKIPEPVRERPKPKPKPKPPMAVWERLLKGREAGARAGKHQSGPAPYGYKREYSKLNGDRVALVIEPKEADVVRAIFREYLRRKSMKRVIDWLSREGMVTRRGKQWSRAGLSWMLKNETYLGRVHFGKIRARGKHPAIIAPIVFNKVAKLIHKNDKRGRKAKK